MKNPSNSTHRRFEWGRFDSPAITPGHILAASRAHDRYLKSTGPREYSMHVYEDGSVHLRNIAIPSLSEVLPFARILEESRDFWLNPRRSLWQHILKIWE